MRTLSRRHFSPRMKELTACTRHGAFWADGGIWLMHCSPYNPVPGRYVRLVDCYERVGAPHLEADEVDRVIGCLRSEVGPEELNEYLVEAAILRATAREWTETGG